MCRNISKKPNLLIVSDTAMWKTEDKVFVFEPVLREIEHLTPLFNKITWIGFQYSNSQRWNSVKRNSDSKINLLLFPRVGGKDILEKLKIAINIPKYFFKIARQVKAHDVIHTRGPSLPAFVTLIIALFIKKKYWHKYAGSWNQTSPPLSYRFQRWWLKKIALSSKVTINGTWIDQPSHILTFENPCLTEAELEASINVALQKKYNDKLNICFVGRIEKEKGAAILIDAIRRSEFADCVDKVFMVGEGKLKDDLIKKTASLSHKVQFTGELKREDLNYIYAKSHVFCLPSESEGFPKVLSEAASFGCVPIVSNISSIGQYINESNGYLLNDISAVAINEIFKEIFENKSKLNDKKNNVVTLARKFTYKRYRDRIACEVIYET